MERRNRDIITELTRLLTAAVSKENTCSFLFLWSVTTRRNMSRKHKDEYYRFFTVSDPRSHEKGYTEYKVTARVGSFSFPSSTDIMHYVY